MLSTEHSDSGVGRPERLLLVGCVVGVLLIVLVASSGHFLIQQQIIQQQDGARIINLAGRQRMLSQRVAKSALRVVSSQDLLLLRGAAEELRASLEELQQTQVGLIRGDPELGLPGNNSNTIIRLLQEAASPLELILRSGERMLAVAGNATLPLQADRFSESGAVLIENEGRFLEVMNRVVLQYEDESRRRVAHTRELENLLYYLLLTILLLEGLFIFRPMILRTRLALKLLRRQERGLLATRRELESTISALRDAQDNLLEVEKKAVLSSVVAGVTHDVNTPLGICVTAASSLQERTREFVRRYKSDEITRARMEEYQGLALESSEIIMQNLQRASELIRNFKQVAVDQSSEQRRRFNLRGYLEDIVRAMDARLRLTEHRINIHCAENLELDSYPGALYQIVTNLIMNSLLHGFENIRAGTVDISAEQQGDRLLLTYHDDGCGLSKQVQSRFFDAFFTTKRDQGGTGIGTHVIRSLVEETLEGEIRLSSEPGDGFEVQISFPIQAAGGAP